jgi:hypothetical protein
MLTIGHTRCSRQWATEISGSIGLDSSPRAQRSKSISLSRGKMSHKSRGEKVSRRGSLTIIDLLKGDLSVLGQALLSLAGKHERLRFLRRRHDGAWLRIHAERIFRKWVRKDDGLKIKETLMEDRPKVDGNQLRLLCKVAEAR